MPLDASLWCCPRRKVLRHRRACRSRRLKSHRANLNGLRRGPICKIGHLSKASPGEAARACVAADEQRPEGHVARLSPALADLQKHDIQAVVQPFVEITACDEGKERSVRRRNDSRVRPVAAKPREQARLFLSAQSRNVFEDQRAFFASSRTGAMVMPGSISDSNAGVA